MSKQTLGQRRVCLSLNPSGLDTADVIKNATAELIDRCEAIKRDAMSGPDAERCAALAQTAYEEAAMWAVKAATGGIASR